MGYDNRFHLVQKYHDYPTELNGNAYYPAEVIATFEACGLDWEAEDKFRNPEKKTQLTFLDEIYKGCDDNGNELYECEYVLKDAYDRPLTEFTVPEAIEILREAERKEHYRRHTPLLGMLLAIDEAEWATLRVLHYGH